MEETPSINELIKDGATIIHKSARAFTGTCFDVAGWAPIFDPETMVYLVYQQEKCPSSGKEHIQFFVRVKKPSKFTGVQKLLGLKQGSTWLMVSRGTDEQNKAYCQKPESRVEGGKQGEAGTPIKGGQGTRSDLETLARAALDPKMTKRAFAEAFPTAILRFARGVDKLQYLAQEKRDGPPLVRIYWGPTGAGKTRKAYEEAKECGQVFMKNMEYKWWDGYEPGDAVIIDDFKDKQCDITYMLNLIDRYPRAYETKGGMTQFNSREIWITANHDPLSWYKGSRPEHRAALARRFKEFCIIKEFVQPIPFEEYPAQIVPDFASD